MLFQKGHTPWNKDKKGIHLSLDTEFKQGNSGYWKGKERSFKTIQKIKKAHKGKHYSPTTEFKKGIKVWNKGKKYPQYSGKNHPLFGKKFSDEIKEKQRQAKLKNPVRYWLGKERIDIKGEKNNNWKGGITPLEHMIRTSPEYNEWRKSIYKKDYWTCQCGSRKNIEAHHKKAFSIILQEFLQQYSQFSPIEDKETLVRLAITYKPFWDLDNGQTLCEKCHKSLKRKFQEVENGQI